MMRTIAVATCALLASLALAQEVNIDNSKLEPLLGDWTGTTQFQTADATPGTIKASKTLSGNWIRLELKFQIEGVGPVEAVAMLCTNANGTVEGHFFASMSHNALVGKGKVTANKLMIVANSLDGESTMNFEFDMSAIDELKFKATDGENNEHFLAGNYKRKK
jgi:hypothetical protein